VENVKKKAGQEGKKKKLFCKKLFVGGKIISFLDVKKNSPRRRRKNLLRQLPNNYKKTNH
jgi:hypothetical protein